MSQPLKLIKQPTVGTTTVTISRERAEFRSHMVMIQFCAETSNREEGEYIIRNLLQTIAFLERKHGLKK